MSEKNLTIIASKGTLDWAYPPFILSSTAAALGYNVTMFFTFLWIAVAEERPESFCESAGQSRHADAHEHG